MYTQKEVNKASQPIQQQHSTGMNMHPSVAQHANAGTVAIEQSRAVAEALGKIQIAKMFPRSMAEAYEKLNNACSRPSFAAIATYAYPRGGQTISGPSIRLAEEIARCFGNIQYGVRELSQRPGESEMQAYAWDMESNTERVMNFTVKHERHTKYGITKLTDPRDIYEMTANQGGRRVRACILAVVDRDLEQFSLDVCKKALAGDSTIPLGDRIRNMIAAFAKLGISSAHIEHRLGVQVDHILPDQMSELTGIYNSLRDGMSKASDWFEMPSSNSQDNPAIQKLNERLNAAPASESLQSGSQTAVNFQNPPQVFNGSHISDEEIQ